MKDSLDLLEFRRRVGTIPEPYVFTPEEIAQGEKEKADAAKRGAKVVPFWVFSVSVCSVAQSCLTLCHPHEL